MSRATEKIGASVVKVRNILWKTVRGVWRSTEKNGASVMKVRNIFHKMLRTFTVRGVWRATEKNGASVVKVRNILWNNLGCVTTDRSVSKKLWNRIEPVGGPLAWECSSGLPFKSFVLLVRRGRVAPGAFIPDVICINTHCRASQNISKWLSSHIWVPGRGPNAASVPTAGDASRTL